MGLYHSMSQNGPLNFLLARTSSDVCISRVICAQNAARVAIIEKVASENLVKFNFVIQQALAIDKRFLLVISIRKQKISPYI